jgi:hypothetical protein
VKVLLMTPAPTHLYLGGIATVTRYREGLQHRGHLCELFGGTNEGGLKQSLEGTIGRFRPDIVHAHDALRCGVHLLGSRTPWVVSLSGEDLHRDALDDQQGPVVCEVLRRAHRVLVPSSAAALAVEERVPDAVGKIDVVARAAARMPTGGTDLRRSLGIPRPSPRRAAAWSGVHPPCCDASTGAPRSTSSRAMSTYPPAAAACSGWIRIGLRAA